MAIPLPSKAELPVNPSVVKWGLGVSWDKGSVALDLDIQAVIVNDKGTIVDAVYYNNIKALKKCVTHSGDELTGDAKGIDESIWIRLPDLPRDIYMFVFVLAAHSNGSLKDVINGKLRIFEETVQNELATFDLEDSSCEVDAVATLVRTSDAGDWTVNIIDVPAQEGCHFIDILEPVIGDLIRERIPTAPMRQKCAFAMEKGSVVDLPVHKDFRHIRAALGWDMATGTKGEVDLDVSVVFFTKDGQALGAVYFHETEKFGVKHSGDNQTGEGDGDDEVIMLDLHAIPANVDSMYFVVNVYTKGVAFETVANAYCRILDQDNQEMARYVLQQGRGEQGLLMARLFREPGQGRWGFQALGQFCHGRNWKESLGDIMPLLRVTPGELQRRAPSMHSIGAPVAPPAGQAQQRPLDSMTTQAPPPAPPQAPPQAEPSQPKGCCSMQ